MISISGVVLAINYALNTYKLGWVQILDVEIGIWLALVGSIFVIIGAIVCRTYNSTIGKFQRKPEPILFSKMPNGLAKQTQFQNSFLKSNKNRINNRESLSSNKYGCKHCGKTIPKTAIQCPHCFSKTN